MTKIDIFNQALTLMGVDPISDENQRDRNGRECRRHYAMASRNILAQFEWSCAMTRAELTALGEEAFGYNADIYPYEYQYPLPNDCLKVVAINESREIPRLKERGYLYTNADEVILSYIGDVSEPEEAGGELVYSDHLAETIVRFMAYKMAPLIAPKMNPQLLYQEYRNAMIEAQDADGSERTEDNTPEAWIYE